VEVVIDETASAGVAGRIAEWGEGAWCLAALAVGGNATASGALAAAAREVIDVAGLSAVVAAPESAGLTPERLVGLATAELLKPAGLVDPSYAGWDTQSEEGLIAQGKASGTAARMFERFFLSQFPGLAERLGTPGARMLDVGTGIGALAVGFAEVFPELAVTGIDVMQRVLQIAERYVATTAVAARIELRQQDVAELTEEKCYDLAWLPAPFVPEGAVREGVGRLVAALRPGGLLQVGHAKFDGSDLENAITRFKILSYGGAPLGGPAVVELLEQRGLTRVQTLFTPRGVPGITVGIRP
jgi:SAM-dependent methyltransferase